MGANRDTTPPDCQREARRPGAQVIAVKSRSRGSRRRPPFSITRNASSRVAIYAIVKNSAKALPGRFPPRPLRRGGGQLVRRRLGRDGSTEAGRGLSGRASRPKSLRCGGRTAPRGSLQEYLVDAGPLVGALLPADQWRDWSRETLVALGASVYTTATVVAEAARHLKPSLPALLQLFRSAGFGTGPTGCGLSAASCRIDAHTRLEAHHPRHHRLAHAAGGLAVPLGRSRVHDSPGRFPSKPYPPDYGGGFSAQSGRVVGYRDRSAGDFRQFVLPAVPLSSAAPGSVWKEGPRPAGLGHLFWFLAK